MLDFRFAFLPALLLLIPALFALMLWMRGQLRAAPPVLRYSDTRLLGNLPPTLRMRLRRLPDFLRILAWCALVIALARPQFGERQDIIAGAGIDIVVALDVSESMFTADFNNQTRLDAARSVIDTFIAERPFDRIGLVVFEEFAYYQSPPTLDKGFLREVLRSIPTAQDLAGANRTAIGLGLASATNMLRYSTAPDQAIILLTDGANTAGSIDPLSAAQATRAYDIRVYTIGLGTGSGESALDETTLQQIAAQTNGRYYNALSLDDLQNVYDQIDQLERSPAAQDINIRWVDQAWIVLIAAFALLLVERFLRVTVFQTIP